MLNTGDWMFGCKGSPSEIENRDLSRIECFKVLDRIENMMSDSIYKDLTPSSYIICLYAVLLMS